MIKNKQPQSNNNKTVTCKSVKCPFVGTDANLCKSCPGPLFFTKHHSCHICPIHKNSSKPDERCIICAGPSDEPNHHGESFISIDAMGGTLPGKPLRIESVDSCINLSRTDLEKSKAAIRFFTEMDEMTFGYVRGMVHGGELMALYDISEERKLALETIDRFNSDVEKRVAKMFLSMTQDEFAIVKHLLAGGNLNTYAMIYNTRRQYAFNKMKELMRRSHPELRAIVKERKQLNGRMLKKEFSKGGSLELK